MANRSTVKVEFIREKANYFLKNSDDRFVEQRKGVASLLETVLHETGNYNGYAYLGTDQMKDSEFGKSVGIIWNEERNEVSGFPDETRRKYF